MGTERIEVAFLINPPGGKKVGCVVSGAKWFYGNTKVAKAIGAVKMTDKRLNDFYQARGTDAKENLVRLIAVMGGQGPVGIGNASQNDSKRRFEFYCDPSEAENALNDLPGLTVDRGAGIGSMKITRVYRKLEISRR